MDKGCIVSICLDLVEDTLLLFHLPTVINTKLLASEYPEWLLACKM